MLPSSVELTILMPCLNEAETIATCIQKAQSFFARSETMGEILIADNGSTDGSQKVAESLGVRVISIKQKGYGSALLGGIEAANGRFIVMGDADDSYDFANLDPFLKKLRSGADLVMGNRFKGGILPGAMPFLHRYLGNPVLSFIGRLFFRIPTGDFHCGLRGFCVDAIRDLRLQTTGMEFASEMIVRSALAGLKIVEVPTTLKPDGRSRPPHLKTWRDGWRHLKFLLMYSPRWLFMIPGAVIAGLGALLASYLYFGPLRLPEHFVLDLNAFVTACFMIVVGTQLLSFGLLSRYYATITGFLPSSPRANNLVKYATTDRIVLLACATMIFGLCLFGFAASSWADVSFGPISNPYIPRSVVGGLTAVAIAVQLFFSAFMFGVLNIPVARIERRRQTLV
jgi:glycosyltransferase involved in cell wall biosynthesis